MTHVPRKRYGQHFLHDRGVIAKIIAAVDPQPGDAIVEVGPGTGALTAPLLDRVARLEAVEIDRDLAARLAAEHPRLRLHRGDVLKFDFAQLSTGLRVVGNLPYNISTPLLFHLVRYAERVRDMHFMLQLEVVDRMVAKHSTPEYGRLSVMLQTRFRMQKLFRVRPGAFRPPPKVDSAFVRLTPLAPHERPDIDEKLFAKLVTGAFSARRKTLRNALPLAPEDYEALAINPRLRPENLSPDDYVRVAQRVRQTNV